MRTLIVAVDGSPPSLRALTVAARLATDPVDAEVVVVFARHAFLALPPDVAQDVESDLFDRVEETVRSAVEAHLAGVDLRWRFEVQLGAAASVVCDVAEANAADFIVVGRTGWSAFHDALIGSVANRLVHHAKSPVIVVP